MRHGHVGTGTGIHLRCKSFGAGSLDCWARARLKSSIGSAVGATLFRAKPLCDQRGGKTGQIDLEALDIAQLLTLGVLMRFGHWDGLDGS